MHRSAVTTVGWTVLWGTAGLILSTPLTVCVIVLGRYVPQFSFLHILFGDEPVLAAEAQLYHRFLAMEPQEARAVADDFLKVRSLIELYDLVIIPALTMAEQDRHKGALDPAREEFLFLSVKEMIAEFRDYERSPDEPLNPPPAIEDQHRIPLGARVLCIPAHDQADEIVCVMLAQILEQSRYTTQSFQVGVSMQELSGFLEPSSDDVVFVSSLPPFAFAHARTLSRQLRARFPKIKLVIGVWSFAGDTEQALKSFDRPHPDRLLTSLEKAGAYLVGRLDDAEVSPLRDAGREISDSMQPVS